MIKRIPLILVLSFVSVAAARAQAPVPVPVYDAVAIKPNKSGSGGVHVSTNDGRFQATNVSLLNLLENAYGIRSGLISGVSGWAASARYDINAKQIDYDPKANQTKEQRQAMMAVMLEERFHLKVHVEVKELPVYDLVVTKDGPKFKESAPEPPADPDAPKKPSGMSGNRGNMNVSGHNGAMELTSWANPMTSFVGSLSILVDRTVIDKTGLKGEYDVHMKWTSDTASPPLPDDAPPTLFTAIQEQLGLKLVPSKGPVNTLVVDHVEQPTEN
jgi:uncharacterized protein (TIGR03435 family)